MTSYSKFFTALITTLARLGQEIDVNTYLYKRLYIVLRAFYTTTFYEDVVFHVFLLLNKLNAL